MKVHVRFLPVKDSRAVKMFVDGWEVKTFPRYRDIPRKWLEMATECCTEYVSGTPVGLSGLELPAV